LGHYFHFGLYKILFYARFSLDSVAIAQTDVEISES